MPYSSISKLPSIIRKHLPRHAQAIYKEAYNHAWEEYRNPQRRYDNFSIEELSHRVAWSAVKNRYIRDESGHWVRRINHQSRSTSKKGGHDA